MKKSIELKSAELLRSKPILPEYGGVGAEIADEENLITAYWRAYEKTQIAKEDFIERLSQVSELLSVKKVDVDKSFIGIDPKVLEAEKITLKEAISPSTKTDNIAEHDAYHRLLINYLRQKEEGSEQKYWFLSFDSRLEIYDAKTRKSGEESFVIMPHQLLQLLRPFVIQRTSNYDETFVELFLRPQLKSSQGVLPTNIVEKILSRISGHKDFPVQVGIKMLLDQNFKKMLLKEQEKGGLTVDTMVDNYVIEQVRVLNDKVLALEKDNLERQKELNAKTAIESNQTEKLGKVEEKLTKYKTWLFTAAIIITVLLNFLVSQYIKWESLDKLYRAIWIAIDLLVLYFGLLIRWKFNKSFNIILGIIGIIGFILTVI
jgi:hypothetical protein